MLADDQTSSATDGRTRRTLPRNARRRSAALRRAVLEVCTGSRHGVCGTAGGPRSRADRIRTLAARVRGHPPSPDMRDAAQGDVRRVLTCSRAARRGLRPGVAGARYLCRIAPGPGGAGARRALARDALPGRRRRRGNRFRFPRGDVVLVSADAVAADWFINKTRTGQLCAAAQLAGTSAYVGRAREVRGAGPQPWQLRDDHPATPERSACYRVRNPLFKRSWNGSPASSPTPVCWSVTWSRRV
jgi:hypothetical protein